MGDLGMDSNKYSVLNKLFTRNSLRSIIENGSSENYEKSIAQFLSVDFNTKNIDILIALYDIMNKEYRNEYYYKNTLLNKLLLGKHNMNTTSALSELPISRSKADFILINGVSEVFEIKTELDTLDRLPLQIEDYYKIFSYVSVLTSDTNYYKVYQLFKGSDIGIKILTKRNTISIKKEPKYNSKLLDATTMFKVLRKSEFENIIKKFFGSLPDVSQFSYYKQCQKLFLSIPILELQKEVSTQLKSRSRIDKSIFESVVPMELRSLAYFSDFSKDELIKMNDFLQKEWR